MASNEGIPSPKNVLEYNPSPEQQERFDLLKNLTTTFEAAGIRYSILGGYGLDALYGKLSRDHDDIDVVAEDEDSDRARALLNSLGFEHRTTQEDVEKYFHFGTKTKLDFISSRTLEKAAGYYPELGLRFEKSLFLPERTNGILGGVPMRTSTLQGQQQIRAIQTRRFGRESPKAAADEELIRKIMYQNT